MANYCTKCGTKLRKDDNFCTNCGTKIDNYNITHLLKTSSDSKEKEKAKKELKKVVGGKLFFNGTFSGALLENGLDITNTGNAIKQQVEKEIESGQIKSGGVEFRVNQLIHDHRIKKEEEDKKLKTIYEIFESEEIQSEIRKNKVDEIHVTPIKDNLKNKIIDKREDMSEEEIKHFIKTELEKAGKELEKARITKVKARTHKEKEISNKKIEKNEMTYGGYCGLSCRHCYEEIIDSGGGITADYSEDMCGVDYYCDLGHSIAYGSFCKDYE